MFVQKRAQLVQGQARNCIRHDRIDLPKILHTRRVIDEARVEDQFFAAERLAEALEDALGGSRNRRPFAIGGRIDISGRGILAAIAGLGAHRAELVVFDGQKIERAHHCLGHRAIDFLTEAARVALDRYAGAAAEEHCSHALALAERLAASDRSRTRIRLLQQRGTIRLGLGNLRGAQADFEQVVVEARELNDLAAEAAALNALANPFLSRYLNRPDEEMRRAQRALGVADQLGINLFG